MLYDREGRDRRALQMKLPRSMHPGETFNLVFLSRAPKPTFGLVPDAPSLASQLSETGRFISMLLQQPLLLPSDNRSAQPNSAQANAAPLFSAPPREGTPAQHTQLAQGLMQAISSSGLFYEFHLAQWVAGKRSLASLLLEPQGRLSGNHLSQLPGTASPPASPTGELRLPALPHQDYPNPMHRDTQALLRQQLDVLENGHLHWQGEIWPGQAIEWDTVGEKMDEPEGDGATRYPVWKTSIRLSLPNLGYISAVLRLGESGIEVRLAATESSAAILRAGAGHLVAGLDSAGIRLSSMGIEANEKAESV